MSAHNPLEVTFRGFVAIDNSGPDGLAVYGTGRRSAQSLRESLNGDWTVVSARRARDIAREVHGWDVASEEELNPAVPSHLA